MKDIAIDKKRMGLFFNRLFIFVDYSLGSERELLTSCSKLDLDNHYTDFCKHNYQLNPYHIPPFDKALLPYLLFRLTPCRKVFQWIATRARYSFTKSLNIGQL